MLARAPGQTPEGLDDMGGNVLEWCRDWFGPYSGQALPNPLGPTTGAARVLRGGSFDGTESSLRAASRRWGAPGIRDVGAGFRVVSSRLRP